MSRRGAASIVASPVLVGAVTVLITVVAVILAYNANQGLPFVPTYSLSTTLPGGANLVEGNEVRIGGFRVGVVDKIGTKVVVDGRGNPKAVAIARMKLDKVVEELPKDTQVLVRPRSALGLKYIEVTPGSSADTYKPGATIPIQNAEGPVEFDDFLNTFQEQVRDDASRAEEGFGNAFAGRGGDINEAIHELRPLFTYLGPVMRSLSDPRTKLDRFFAEIGETSADVARSCASGGTTGERLPEGAYRTGASAPAAQSLACSQPVSAVQARLFSEMADTFEAIGRDPEALRQFIEKGAPTNYAAIESFRVQKPFLADFTDLSHRLRPAARELPRGLPDINEAIIVAQPVLPRTVALNQRTEDLFRAVDELAQRPSTLIGLKDLTETLRVGAPLVEFLAPYQTVCNYWTQNWTTLGEHLSGTTESGTVQRVLVKSGNNTQDDRITDSNADRPADTPANEDPQKDQAGGDERIQDAIDAINKQIDELQKAKSDLAADPTTAKIPKQFRDLVPGGTLPGGVLPAGTASETIDAINDAIDAAIDRLQKLLKDLLAESGQPPQVFHGQSYQPAVDGQGNADCQNGQNGYLDRLITTNRYPPSDNPDKNGGSHVVVDSDTPGNAGPTFKGVPNLRDVDAEQRSRQPKGEVPDPGDKALPDSDAEAGAR